MKGPDQKSQNNIIEGYVKGTAREFFVITGWIEEVVRNYHWGLHNFQEDIIQDVRLKVYINLKQNKFRRASMLKTYVYRIAKYTCIDYLRKLGSKHSDNTDIGEIGDNDNALDQMIDREKQAIFESILKELAEMCREMLKLVMVEKLTYNEISILLNIAEGTVKSRVSRCIEKAVRLKEKYWNDLQVNTTVKLKSE